MTLHNLGKITMLIARALGGVRASATACKNDANAMRICKTKDPKHSSL